MNKGEQTVRDWRAAWKRGANLLVWNGDGVMMKSEMRIYLRMPGERRRVSAFDYRKRKSGWFWGTPVQFAYVSEHTFTWELARLLETKSGMPALNLRYSSRSLPLTAHPSEAYIGAYVESLDKIEWIDSHVTVPDGVFTGGVRQDVPVDEFLDLYGTQIDTMLEIARQDLPTGAYTVNL